MLSVRNELMPKKYLSIEYRTCYCEDMRIANFRAYDILLMSDCISLPNVRINLTTTVTEVRSGAKLYTRNVTLQYSWGLGSRSCSHITAVICFPAIYSVWLSTRWDNNVNPLNPELNPICYLLALLAHHFLHVSRTRVKSLTIRLLMYMERLFLMFLDHT